MKDEIFDWRPEWSETVWDEKLIRRFHETVFDIILTEPLPALENLALDRALLDSVAAGNRGAVAWFWEWSEAAVILGSYQSVMNEFDDAVARELGFTFARRISGGGAMVVEPAKTLTYSIIVPEYFLEGLSFVQSFAFLDHWCVRALRSIGVPATYRPINDIASPHGKIGGAAQCRRRRTVLHHTAMAYDLDDAIMRSLLRHGQAKPVSRGIPSAEKTVSSLTDFIDMSHADLRQYLHSAFVTLFPTKLSTLTDIEHADAAEHLKTLSSEQWLYRVE
jgi:lipoate---protein ligase